MERKAPRVPRLRAVASNEAIRKHDGLVRSITDRYTSKLPNHHRGQYDEDLQQEGRLGVLDAVRRHDPAKGAFTTIAVPCIRTRVIAALRRLGRHSVRTTSITPEILEDVEASHDTMITEAEQDAAVYTHEIESPVRAFVAYLTPDQRDIVRAVFWHGDTQAQVAARRGVSRANVNQILKRVLERGRVSLAKYAAAA